MSKALVLTLISNLSLSDADATQAGVFYDQVVRELGFLDVLTDEDSIAVTAGDATYTANSGTVRVLEIFSALYGSLTPATLSSMQAVRGHQWRDVAGTPEQFIMHAEDEKDWLLVPIPDDADTLTVLRTETRTDVPVWLELGITFEVLYRLYQQESPYQDVDFAATCRSLGQLLFLMVGVNFHATS